MKRNGPGKVDSEGETGPGIYIRIQSVGFCIDRLTACSYSDECTGREA